MDILKQLYIYLQEAHEDSYAYSEACRKESALWDKLLAHLSAGEMDDLLSRQADMLTAANLDWFREGFQLGASLMLELLPQRVSHSTPF